MKRWITRVLLFNLCLMLLPLAALAEAESAFDGVWIKLGKSGFQVYLPAQWYLYEKDNSQSPNDVLFIAGDRDIDKYLIVQPVMNSELASFEQALILLAQDMPDIAIEAVEEWEGFRAARYESKAGDQLGLIIENPDRTRFYIARIITAGDDAFAASGRSALETISLTEDHE